jgi:hypothetical protein
MKRGSWRKPDLIDEQEELIYRSGPQGGDRGTWRAHRRADCFWIVIDICLVLKRDKMKVTFINRFYYMSD